MMFRLAILLGCAELSIGVALPRRALLQGATGSLFGAAAASRTGVGAACAVDAPAAKLTGLSPKAIAAMVEKDMSENQFLVTGKLTRSIYAESASFKDEIDTYTLDKWIKGTGALFAGPPSSFTEIVGEVQSSESEVRFRFNEVLCFNVPFNPKIPLTGEVILTLGGDGLITKYLEVWDTNLADTLKKTYF